MIPLALRQSLEKCTTLPSLPTVVQRVIELARDPHANVQDIGATISNDPALSVRLLSLANTVFYSADRPAEDLRQAVNRIGIERTLSLALGCSLVSATGTQDAPGLNLERYWQRSLICALSAKSLAETLELDGESGALFTASLLQDIGMLALYAADAGRYRPLLESARSHEELVTQERRVYGIDHAEVGGWLAEKWQLSERTSRWILHSHDSMVSAETRGQRAGNCIIASGVLADAWLEGEASLSVAMASLDFHFGLETPQMISKIMLLQEQLPAVASLYQVALPARLDANDLMFEAKLLLAERNARLQQDLARQQKEIEALRQEHEALSVQARFDPLTKLYNRLHLEKLLRERFDEACNCGRALSVIFIDLDHFKAINDDFGHYVGDQVLQSFAGLLSRMLEGRDDIHVGRYGGEEFVVVLPGREACLAKEFAGQIRERLSAAPLCQVQGKSIFVTASYGVASIGEDCGLCDCGIDALLKAADRNMYEAKRIGRNRITLSSDIPYLSRA
ncbi:sensor domain-containing diguanylate cyclase [Halomonas sp. WWR20]